VPPDQLVGDVTTELVAAAEGPLAEGVNIPNVRLHWLGTLADPDSVTIDASEHRAALATRAGVLSAALDTARTAKASNSIEKMLRHQMAAVHVGGMELLVKIEEWPALRSAHQIGDLAKLTNASARLFEVFQSGCLTLQKLKTSGRQHVVVQPRQVNVGNGVRAIVAGQVKRPRCLALPQPVCR